MSASEHIGSAILAHFGDAPPARLGVAVSGGGDSVALMHALALAYRDQPVQIETATVDHGLRPGSADEALRVAEQARDLGLAHTILRWSDWDGRGNVQDQARQARYRLLAGWARDNQLGAVALGHTQDDQGETVLMRLTRRSGVRGLSAMRPRRLVHGVEFARPLLGVTRATLRAYLRELDVRWIDDPSNDDTRFDRVRMRQALDALADVGLTAGMLADVARHMQSASDALDWYTFLAARELVTVHQGSVLIERRGFRTLPAETARGLIQNAVNWITGAHHPLRSAKMERVIHALRLGERTTVGGVIATHHQGMIWLAREYEAVRELRVSSHEVWDSRWQAQGPDGARAELRALGPEGLQQCPDWRQTGAPRPALISAPAIWNGDQLLAAPAAGITGPWRIGLLEDGESFYTGILSH
ncbi:MAG: tRNA lysidine(34) synthetase TilS [Marinibacterium sp.]|nr:tRNA lysidine(34) synthetase TilS [Marinibacterium sp.]